MGVLEGVQLSDFNLKYEEATTRRTIVRDLDNESMHVGTIVEQEPPRPRKPGQYMWITRGRSGHVGSYQEAVMSIERELAR